MKLRTKLFHISDSQGNNIEPDDHDIILMLNGEPTETRVKDVFSDYEPDENELYGNSLLSYFTLQDGKLVAEGSIIELAIAGTHERVLINAITRPGVNDDTNIPFEHIQKFCEFFKVAKPDEVFDNLNAEEKQVFIDARLNQQKEVEQTNSKQAEKEQAEKEQAEKEKTKLENETRKQAEAELKKSIDPEYIQEKKEFISTQSFYRSLGFKEYVLGPYHLFFGVSDTETAFVLIKRGETWWEQPNDTSIIDENDKTVTIEFNDGDQLKQIELDISTGEVTVTDSEVIE